MRIVEKIKEGKMGAVIMADEYGTYELTIFVDGEEVEEGTVENLEDAETAIEAMFKKYNQGQ